MNPRRTLALVALCLALLSAGGCAYEGRWSAAGKEPTPSDQITGRWIGTWTSEASGHSGGLRCIVTRTDSGRFKADFRATYAWLFSFGYEMAMNVRASDAATNPSVVYFTGEEDLGALAGGEYTYDGRATPTEFFCKYKTKDDHGTFQLVRPGGTPVMEPAPAVVSRE
ncbi:MAG TPA: hypothetical protein VF796_18340 [Humisphaera sp.]